MEFLERIRTKGMEMISGMSMEEGVFLLCFLLLVIFGILIILLQRRARRAEHQAKEASKEALRQLQAAQEETRQDAMETRARMEEAMERMGGAMQSMMGQIEEVQQSQQDVLSGQLRTITRDLNEQLGEMEKNQKTQMEALRTSMENQIQDVVDRRFEDSFTQVSGRLEQVSESLKAISSLAGSVDEFNRLVGQTQPVGIYGEAQLGTLLAQMLAPQQYAQRCRVSPDREDTADYAVVMPGQGGENSVYLPIDASLPTREYQELRAALENGTRQEADNAREMLESAVRMHARRVSEKIIAPPYTTDYAIVFLPSEGLYAEILRIPDLADRIQRESKIVLAGPATLAALLSSLQVGFRSLAIEQHTDEILQVLGAVRTDFVRYAGVLERTQRRLRQATEEIESAQRQGETISRRLSDIGEVPKKEARRILGTRALEADEDEWD